MKARRITAKVIATPDELAALLALLEAERDRRFKTNESNTPLGQALWAATDGVGAALETHARRRAGSITLAQSKLGQIK